MIKYLIYAFLNILCMLLGYLTNWFVVLFANEEGELPKIFKLWQTWDSSLDNRTYVTEDCPSFLRYDFDSYYTIYRKELNGQDKKYVVLKKPFEGIKLRLKRYLNRVFWLYRNCGYGFSYYLFGITVSSKDLQTVKDISYNDMPRTKKGKVRTYEKVVDTNSKYNTILNRPFYIKTNKCFNKYIATDWYIGWKMKKDNKHNEHRAMIANRLSIRFLFLQKQIY